MKVTLNEEGMLIVRGETPVENFALSHWYELWGKDQAHFMVTTTELSDDGFYDPRLSNVTPDGKDSYAVSESE